MTFPPYQHFVDHVNALVADWKKLGDVSAYVPLAPPVPTSSIRWPHGKGMMVWNLPGDLTAAVQQLKAAGIEWVAVKVNDGAASLATQSLADFVGMLGAQGINVWGWGYEYLADPAGEARAAAGVCNQLNLKGYLIDAEGEATAAGAAKADEFSNALASTLHVSYIGLCSFRYPSYHMDFPWQGFLPYCTFHAPQVYWLGDNSLTGPCVQLTRSVNELTALKKIPVCPIGVAAAWQNWQPSAGQLTNFINCANTLGLPGYSFWDLEQASVHADWWAAISAAAVG